MRKIVVIGWNDGFEKIGFTKLFHSELGYSLKDAKLTTDQVLDGEQIFIEVTEERYKHLACELTSLGAKIGLDE